MEIESFIDLVNGAYVTQIGLTTGTSAKPLSALEQEIWADFGEPLIECGGDFLDPDDSEVTLYSLPLDSRRLPSQFPVKKTFDTSDSANAKVRATVYRDTLIARIETARNTHLGLATSVPGHTITTVNTPYTP
jgi:hypothetical protein